MAAKKAKLLVAPRARKKTIVAKKVVAKKAPATRTAKKVVKKAPPRKAPAKKAATRPAKKIAVKKAPAKKLTPRKAPQKAAPQVLPKKARAKAAPARLAAPAAPKPKRSPVRRGPAYDKAFLSEQEALLQEERADYMRQAEMFKAEADLLALEMEPGDVQFDEESGEGASASVDRERDLVLSAQARAAVEDIDRALVKIKDGSYGLCERCGKPLPKLRLRAIPYADLCVDCKSGGLSRRL